MLTQRELCFKRKLIECLEPHSTWKQNPSSEEQEAARRALLSVCDLLKNPPLFPPSRIPSHDLLYLQALGLVYFELQSHQYLNACNELEKLIHFHHILDPAIHENVLALLEQYLEEVNGNEVAMA